jgi:hypothetical protein
VVPEGFCAAKVSRQPLRRLAVPFNLGLRPGDRSVN